MQLNTFPSKNRLFADTLDKLKNPPLFIRVFGASHRPNSRQNDQTRQKGKNRVDGRHGKIRRGMLAEISDRKHLTLGNKPILATFSGLLSAPGFSRLAC
jgi:hypothetical protein